jgi:G:T-mismatch repair DNA endonuclease (very short patch repair protein)
VGFQDNLFYFLLVGLTVLHFILIGCYWHGHNCHLNEGKEVNEKRDKPMKKLIEETQRNSGYIRRQGFNLVECWECEWREMKKRNSGLQRSIATQTSPTFRQIKNDDN